MTATPITAVSFSQRRIKRKAHLLTLLACLTGCAAAVYWFATGVGFWFWLLTSGASVLVVAAGLAWVFERPKSTLLIGAKSPGSQRQIE
jgi:hypothetical protein